MSLSIAAPALSSSIRRSSISSVTSLGRKRKEPLDQHSQPSDDDVSMRSRQLGCGSADDGDEDDEYEEDTGDSDSSVESQADDVTEGINARRRGGRRQTVFWSDEEEKFLRHGVKKYGTGKWKQILIDGQDVFSKHRTNVDLKVQNAIEIDRLCTCVVVAHVKDKWKNMQNTKFTTRKRPAEGNNLSPLVKQEEQPTVHRASRVSVKKSRSRNDASAIPLVIRARLRTDRRAAIVANRAIANVKEQEVDVDSLPSEEDEDYPGEETGDGSDLKLTGSYDLSEHIVLKFVTDRSFPELIEVRVSFDACKDVSVLKKLLRSSILSDVLPNTEVQMIGLKSRQLFDDDELLSQCIKENGVDFFLVFEDAPKVFAR
ncbi:hypothetical protein DD238_000254 [Peronospora effusa]|uniref:HTH myb-type domain-containing protein n=1 Tax=Peronospora effusa TaxID=542832 RepID=A0A3M6VUU2_9STRA|nr:hypothetical protein DD238_000254 [Peronospora effusa]RQM09000.1 hypothetical protein DD237_000488 [Peronospora effusa]